MIKPTDPPAPKLKTVEQQKTDFTAEGSPPPGVVGAPVPDKESEGKHGEPRATIHLPHARKHPSPDKNAAENKQ